MKKNVGDRERKNGQRKQPYPARPATVLNSGSRSEKGQTNVRRGQKRVLAWHRIAPLWSALESPCSVGQAH